MEKYAEGLRREMPSVFSVLSFPEQLVSIEVADIFKTRFYQLACFLFGVCNFGCEVVIFEVYKLRVALME